MLYEADENNNLTKLYTYSSDGILLSMTKVDGANKTTYYYHYNARGDVVKLTSQDGTEVASYTYDAWGNILSSSGTMAEENQYRYAGYRYDSDISLYYLMARYYNPETGRFLSKDPIPDAMNDYIYSGNNPVNYVDLDGEKHDPYMGNGGGGPKINFNSTTPKVKVKTGSTKGTSKSFKNYSAKEIERKYGLNKGQFHQIKQDIIKALSSKNSPYKDSMKKVGKNLGMEKLLSIQIGILKVFFLRKVVGKMSYDLEVLVVNQTKPVSIPFSKTITI